MKKILIVTLLLLTSLLDAKQFTATYISVIGDEFGHTAQFNVGEPLIIEIVLDNGNDNMISQRWTADDVVSVTFKFNSAPNTITSVFSSVEDHTEGNFTTNALGDLTGVPTKWITKNRSVNDTLVISTNDEYLTESYDVFTWYINGLNNIYFTDDSNNEVGDRNVTHNIDPAYWTLSETQESSDSSTSGGGCTYNPNNKGIDMMFLLLLLLAAAYPLRAKFIREHN